eukprot:675646-Amphidinium_carterae.1
MYGPKDPITSSSGCFGGGKEIYEIHGNVYGLANAPATFSASVVRRLHSIGFVTHPLDSMLFVKYGSLGTDTDTQQRVVALAGLHVDDLIMPRKESVVTFTGRQLQVLPNGTVVVCQPNFIQTVPTKHATMRGPADDSLTSESDRTAFRSATGT